MCSKPNAEAVNKQLQFNPRLCQSLSLSSKNFVHGLAVPRAGYGSYVTRLIHGWLQSHLMYLLGGCRFKERKLTSQSSSLTVEFSVQ